MPPRPAGKRVLARHIRDTKHFDRTVLEPMCGYPAHRDLGGDWCRLPRTPRLTWEKVALCGTCHPALENYP
jgi:hypothetical protein